MVKEFIPLNSPIIMDTIISVKIGNTFKKYPVHAIYKGRQRYMSDLYNYFIQLPEFRFAIGYLMEESENHYKARSQYFYFDAKTNPYLCVKQLSDPLIIPKV